eukprot:gene14598-20647_t
MPTPKTRNSRKGKKAWRKNIDATQEVEFIEAASHQARRGPAVETLEDSDLFFIDKVAHSPIERHLLVSTPMDAQWLQATNSYSHTHASEVVMISCHNHAASLSLAMPVFLFAPIIFYNQPRFIFGTADEGGAKLAATTGKRKMRQELKPLRSQQILEAAHGAKAVLFFDKPMKKAKTVLFFDKPMKKVGPSGSTTRMLKEEEARKKRFGDIPEEALDIWSGAQGSLATTSTPSTSGHLAEGPAPGRHRMKERQVKGPSSHKSARAKAVQVDMAGCSYNPDRELHQEAMAELVSSEMKKILKRDLQHKLQPVAANGAVLTLEEEMMQIQEEKPAAEDDENEIELDEDSEDEEGAVGYRAASQAKKTTKDRNKEKRRYDADRELEERRRAKKQRRDIEQLRTLKEELEAEAADKDQRLQRRNLVRSERENTLPPRLGKHKFEPHSVQVMLTEELGVGSLRQVKSSPMMAKERYKSLQRRGMIEPRMRQGARTKRKQVEYEKGARREKILESQAELEDLRKSNNMKRREARREAPL